MYLYELGSGGGFLSFTSVFMCLSVSVICMLLPATVRILSPSGSYNYAFCCCIRHVFLAVIMPVLLCAVVSVKLFNLLLHLSLSLFLIFSVSVCLPVSLRGELKSLELWGKHYRDIALRVSHLIEQIFFFCKLQGN